MAQAAKRQYGDIDTGSSEFGSSDLLRRLLSPRGRASDASPVPSVQPAVAELEATETQDAAITILKAALRAERAEVESLQAEVAELRAAQDPLTDVRIERDRWAGLVEKLVLHRR